jgi:hypothetical protein
MRSHRRSYGSLRRGDNPPNGPVCNGEDAVYVSGEVVMVFRAFLEQRRSRPRRGRAHVGSLLLHLAVLVVMALAARELRPEEPALAAAPTVLAVTLLAPRPGVPAAGRSASPPASATARPPAAPAVKTAAPARKRALRPRRPAVARQLPPVPEAPAVEVPAETSGEHPGGMSGEPIAVAFGAGAEGEGAGDGGGSVRGRRPELFARVIGSGLAAESPARRDRPFVSLKEATTLRTHDYFPRLPAALWPERGPYVVAIELCVSEQGQVSEAELLSGASPRLDPMVLAAVRGWRYRPRLEGGKPSPFCHGVIIKYERHY